MFQTSIETRGTDYAPYFDTLRSHFSDLDIASVDGEARWTKFLLHGVPLECSMDQVSESLRQNYPSLPLAQIPRWLSTPFQRQQPDRNGQPKRVSSVVIAILGSHSLTSIGLRYLTVCNSYCRLDTYYSYGSQIQCPKCHRLGHLVQQCKADSFTCGNCGQPHSTQSHTCPADGCPQGARCIHDIFCVNCNTNFHKSSDPNCPAKMKARQVARSVTMVPGANMDTL